MHGNFGGAALGTFFFNRAQHLQRAAFHPAHCATAQAMRTGDEGLFSDGRPQALAAHFQKAEMANAAHLDARAIMAQRFLHAPFHHGVILVRLHIDEVDDNQPGQVAQAQLAGDFFRRFHIRAQGRVFDMPVARGAARIHVNRDQRFGLVDHHVTAGTQLHHGRMHRIQLLVHVMAREKRRSIAVQAHLIRVGWHQHAHEFARLLEGAIAFHHHLINIAAINIADGPLDQIRFFVNQRGRGGSQRPFADIVPKTQQVFAITLNFRLWPLRAGCAHNQRHALRQLQIIHHFA